MNVDEFDKKRDLERPGKIFCLIQESFPHHIAPALARNKMKLGIDIHISFSLVIAGRVGIPTTDFFYHNPVANKVQVNSMGFLDWNEMSTRSPYTQT